eukprot:XP_014056857.1 PREDICTED: N(4)-(Beta-N-acetylglucosaminyl)-L-asparaginase-like [Salmo salar]
MDRSPHSLLVGEGAVAFAREQGFTIEPDDNMLSAHSAKAYQEFLEQKQSVSGHDTLGLIALDSMGNITVGVSTGAPFKSPGRVGDSPLPDVAYTLNTWWEQRQDVNYLDDLFFECSNISHTALACLELLATFTSTDSLSLPQGLSPNRACYTVLDDIIRRTAPDKCFEIGLIALT